MEIKKKYVLFGMGGGLGLGEILDFLLYIPIPKLKMGFSPILVDNSSYSATQ